MHCFKKRSLHYCPLVSRGSISTCSEDQTQGGHPTIFRGGGRGGWVPPCGGDSHPDVHKAPVCTPSMCHRSQGTALRTVAAWTTKDNRMCVAGG